MKQITASNFLLAVFASAQLVMPQIEESQPILPSASPGQPPPGIQNPGLVLCPYASGTFCLDAATLIPGFRASLMRSKGAELLQNFPPTSLRGGFCYQPDPAQKAACGKSDFVYPDDAEPFRLNTTPHNWPVYAPSNIPEMQEHPPIVKKSCFGGPDGIGQNGAVFVAPGVVLLPGPVILEHLPPELSGKPPRRRRSLEAMLRKRNGRSDSSDPDIEGSSESKPVESGPKNGTLVHEEGSDDEGSTDEEELEKEEDEFLGATSRDSEKVESGSKSTTGIHGHLGLAALLAAGIMMI
ncbi:hypothetical protein FN846DRAFT_887236 [Sphaerosporella brunnea]|uniref:Uncharacterized protein n=1 Tax=Sphaerosporella brunnea TaxID=1250544 RepID=A0A5J5F6L2_9PEZI|nr:hypothetical protein FN846DRAFT_887236 [Sphaerosporella brunnea]